MVLTDGVLVTKVTDIIVSVVTMEEGALVKKAADGIPVKVVLVVDTGMLIVGVGVAAVDVVITNKTKMRSNNHFSKCIANS